ncbi:glycosyltransferase [Aestuariivita sp.]|jgi:glycosyltransferase involved in cell wall biosynthesis|uniref:glycosyltransferase n=1 Tax=Aestuariivita sp. TaxID=1872407 RepID=UPI00216EB885|nr:glycosyltransferase [Aestuariivita sp.]MCE8009861.1 glycosyltransferase [Aestuariivita sp.]
MNAWLIEGINPAETVPGILVSHDPLVYLLGLNTGSTGPGLLRHDAFLDTKVKHFFFVNPMWTLTGAAFRAQVVDRLNSAAVNFPQHTYVLLVNDPDDISIKETLDPSIAVYVCGEHALASTDIFQHNPVSRRYDAVYIAQNHAGKRIDLACKIDTVCLISRGFSSVDAEAKAALFRTLYCPNITIGDLVAEQVAEFLNASGVGLILSEREGQNRATIEYLLCGLPVVTTANVGGRDRFLVPANSIYTLPDPQTIADAVSYVIRSDFDRQAVAQLATQSVHRERKWLSHIVDSTLESHGYRPIDIASKPLPHHGFSRSRSMADFLNQRFKALAN